MPMGKGTYGSKKGRPPKKKTKRAQPAEPASKAGEGSLKSDADSKPRRTRRKKG